MSIPVPPPGPEADGRLAKDTGRSASLDPDRWPPSITRPGLPPSGRVLPLTCLAPDIVEAILDGRQQKGLKLAEMLGNGPLSWKGERVI